MADWDTAALNGDTASTHHSRESSQSSEYSVLNKENHTLQRMDSEFSSIGSEKELILQGGKGLREESRTELAYDNSAMTNGHSESPEIPGRKPSSHHVLGSNSNEGTVKSKIAKSPFAPSTIDAIPEEEVTIPGDGNLSTFTADQMANFFRCLKIDDRLVSHLHRKNVDGKRFGKLRDSELENIGLQSHPVILFFREKSNSKSKKNKQGWIL